VRGPPPPRPPARPARVAGPISQTNLAQPTPVAKAPRTAPPPLRMPRAAPPPVASSLDEIDVDVDLEDRPTNVAPEPSSPKLSQIDDEVTNVRDLSAPAVVPVAPMRSGPVQLAPRAAGKIDLGVEPERQRTA